LWLWYNSPPGESSEIRMRLLERSFTLYTSLSVRVSRIRAKLVCLSITSKQAKVALECCQAVHGWKWRCPLTDRAQESIMWLSVTVSQVTVMWHHMTKSHGDHEKVVHKPCSSCISSIENLTGTLLSSLYQLGLGE